MKICAGHAGFIILLSLFLFPISSNARLGETPEQLIARFGTPIRKNDVPTFQNAVNMGFISGNYEIRVLLIDGIAERVSYVKKTMFEGDELPQIMQNNSQGFTWGNPYDKSGYTAWDRSDGGCCSYVYTPHRDDWTIEIQSGTIMRLEREKKNQQRNSTMKGFNSL